MNLVLLALIVVIVVALLVWATDYLPLPQPFNGLIKFLWILLGVLIIVQRAGLI